MIEANSKSVTFGQGEYVVFNPDSKDALPRETFEKAYQILNDYAPAAIINRNAADECDKRYDLIREKIKEMNSSLEIAFIPRTLYELVFIKKCIQEDLRDKQVCICLNPQAHKKTVKDFNNDEKKFEVYEQKRSEILTKKKCWHLAHFEDAGDNHHKGVKDVAFRLNRLLTKRFSPKLEGFTCEELKQFANLEIEFLKTHYSNGQEAKERLKKGEQFTCVFSTSFPGPTTNFGYESQMGFIKPMGIRHESDAKIIIDALERDCGATSFIIYRGTECIDRDQPYGNIDDERPFSLSYGSSLFAGSVFDAEASAFYNIRKCQKGYALEIPYDQLNTSPFYIPPTHTLAQLFGHGEVFHARTKVWKDHSVMSIDGINMFGRNRYQRDHLQSGLTRKELVLQFKKYKAKAVLLNI